MSLAQSAATRLEDAADRRRQAVMTGAEPVPDGMFDGGPFEALQRRLGLIKAERAHLRRRAIFIMALSWLPLLILSLTEGPPFPQAKAFMADFAAHARYLIAIPLLIAAEITCPPRLSAIARHFFNTGMVPEEERDRFAAAALAAVRWHGSVRAEMSIAILAYGLTGLLMSSVPIGSFPLWHHQTIGGGEAFTLAGWWHSLVSAPLLLALILWWLWRIWLWSQFLWRVSKLNLQLVPAHPDRAAGLMFVGYSVRACAILGFALGVIVAGTMANQVFHDNAPLDNLGPVALGLVAVSLALFCTPVACFMPNLLRAWRRGSFEYGALAGGVGRQFERQWLNRKDGISPDALDVQHFSATTDLYSIVSNVYGMRLIPLDTKSFLYMAVATLLPLLPVVVLATPFDVVLERAAGLLF
jgi:hypothetical protein